MVAGTATTIQANSQQVLREERRFFLGYQAPSAGGLYSAFRRDSSICSGLTAFVLAPSSTPVSDAFTRCGLSDLTVLFGTTLPRVNLAGIVRNSGQYVV